MRLIPMQFNNYFNRIVKKYNTINDYITHASNPTSVGPSMYIQDDTGNPAKINFKPNDDVETTQFINWPNSWMPDYLLVVDDTTTDIHSRWFVTESVRTRGNQYKLSLRRDLIADNFDAFQESVALIQKGKPLSTEDVSIYNREDFNGNEIKTLESKLKDSSATAWIVGYYTNTNDVTVTIPVSSYDMSYTDLEDWAYYDYVGSIHKEITNFNIKVRATKKGNSGNAFYTFDTEGNNIYTPSGGLPLPKYNAQINPDYVRSAIDYLIDNKGDYISNFCILHSGYTNTTLDENLIDGLIIYISGDSAYYKVHVNISYGTFNVTNTKDDSVDVAINTDLKNEIGSSDYIYPVSSGVVNTSCYGDVRNVSITLEDVTNEMFAMTVTIPSTSNTLKDAPYKMFAIPYDRINVRKKNDSTGGTNPDFNSLTNNLTIQIPALLQSANHITLYDVQLLPYCPMPKQIIKYGAEISNLGVFYENLTQNYDYSFIIDSGSNNAGIILFPTESSFNTIAKTYYTDTQSTNNVETFKVMNQFNKMRLVSPNYASSFEMKITNNGSFINFNVACTYKPYIPYINVFPSKIDKLYGRDYKDGFGLILQGDFGICLMNDEWKQYQINNKNYLNAFNRSIESLDIRQEYERVQNIVGAITGTVGGASSGLMAGGITGAVAGGVASGAAGAVDIMYGEKLRADTKDLAIDNFYYNIANVKARPQTIAKVSAFDINNKIWPILELYSATDWEKETFKRKLKYTGYTINRIAKIKEYYDNSTFIKGMIIKCELLNDTHVLNALYEEFVKGVYANEPTI